MEYIIDCFKILILMIYMINRYIQNWFGKIVSILNIVNKSFAVIIVQEVYVWPWHIPVDCPWNMYQ